MELPCAAILFNLLAGRLLSKYKSHTVEQTLLRRELKNKNGYFCKRSQRYAKPSYCLKPR